MFLMNQPFFILCRLMKYKIPLQIVELEDDNFHLTALSVFSDGKTGRWIVDTGASRTVFDKNSKDKYSVPFEENGQLHTAGIGDKPVETTTARMTPFFLEKMLVENLNVALIDLSHINKLYSSAANLQICGLLGGDFLMRYNAVVDYRNRRMMLEKEGKIFSLKLFSTAVF